MLPVFIEHPEQPPAKRIRVEDTSASAASTNGTFELASHSTPSASNNPEGSFRNIMGELVLVSRLPESDEHQGTVDSETLLSPASRAESL